MKPIARLFSNDKANKIVVMLDSNGITASLSKTKDLYTVSVPSESSMKARALLSDFNFYFEREDLTSLLESKFASLSKLEAIKGNLLESKEISNKINTIPGVFNADVVIVGDKAKRISILVMSNADLEEDVKSSIESFLKGLVFEEDTLSVNYIVKTYKSDKE
ncbi:MAG: hypothetical protein OXC07_09695 [Kistimonas sp.]|nr:hypothetical protein [Kistimonas sp.]